MVELQIQKKNFYYLQTMLDEIWNYDVISFDIFDTLLLRDVLFPRDIFKLLENRMQESLGVSGFCNVRIQVEQELRQHSVQDDVLLDEIYDEIGIRCPGYPIGQIKNWEIELELDHILPNALMVQIYQAAFTAGKTIWLISDMYLPGPVVKELLSHCGITGYDKLYLSSEIGKSKATGNLFRYIKEQQTIDPQRWLHIGDNRHSDIDIPRQLGIAAAFYRCPRDYFLMKREVTHESTEESAEYTLPVPPLESSLEFSLYTAQQICRRYTEVSAPKEDVVISVSNVSMMFNMSREKVDNIKEYIIRLLKRQLMFQEFWALHDVNFEVRRGEKVGLIGLNGSGKSTLLKIVSGVMKPTKGSVHVKGSIAPLIELGAGFDFELSARENVYLNGAILGYSNEEMDKYYESIIDFAELKEFENVAIKNFSSGMIARLGFSIATSHVPDILIIDEILSVGDFAFQEKCHRKMEMLTNEGATVLFVSHSADDIINMCDRVIWLNHGRIVQQGEARLVVEKYINL